MGRGFLCDVCFSVAKWAIFLSATVLAVSCNAGSTLACDASDTLTTNDLLFEFMAEIDELVHGNEITQAESRVQAVTSDGALRSVLLARIQILGKHQEVDEAIGRKIEQRAFGLRVARSLFSRMELQPFFSRQNQILSEACHRHQEDFRVSFVVAATSIEHIVRSQRHMIRLHEVGASHDLGEFIRLSKAEFVSDSMNQLAAEALKLSQQLGGNCAGTKIYTGIAMNSAGGSEGTELILAGLNEKTCFPFAVQFLMETLDSNGIAESEEGFREIVIVLSRQGKALDRIVAAAKQKYEDDYDTALRGTAVTASSGSVSEVFLVRAQRAYRFKEACNILAAGARTISNAGDSARQPADSDNNRQ